MPENAIITEAKERLKQCIDDEAEVRRACLDDLEFLSASPDNPTQWSQAALKDRALTGRPALVVNRLDQFVQHISNSMRQNRVSARVFPVDDKGDIETAEVLQGVIRNIEVQSKGTLAYDTAAFYAVAMGFWFWRLNTDYTDPMSFEQDIKIERCDNAFQWYLGPHNNPDGSDAEYGFIFAELTKEEFEKEYGKKAVASVEWAGDLPSTWASEDKTRIVEYFKKEYTEGTLVALPDGSTALESDLEGVDTTDLKTRPTKTCVVKWYKLSANEILDETEWPIDRIPIVKVTGHELNVNGKQILKGIVRNLKDAQRQYNYMLSAQTEAIDASKGQLIVAEGQLEGHEEEFRDSSRQKVLSYKATDIAGHPVAPPNRLPPNMSIQAMTEARLLAVEDLKALASLYDAALGNRSNETSGRGILARQQQSETANFHFQDNLLLSITYSTQMLVDLILTVYDTPRAVRTLGEDDSHKIAHINQIFKDKSGKQTNYRMDVGKYDVVCTAGPSFQTKRSEAAALLTQLAKDAPPIMMAAPDLVMKALDVPYAQEIAERLKKTLPPNLQDPEEGQPEVPPQVQQQLAQMSQMVELLTKELEAKTRIVEQKQLELDSKERIEQGKLKVEMEKLAIEREKIQAEMLQLQAKLDSQESIELLKAEIEGIKAQMDVNSRQLAEETGEAARTM